MTCLVCGVANAPFGYWDGQDWTWYCRRHEDRGKAIPKDPPPRLDGVPPSPQGELDLGLDPKGEEAYLAFLRSGTWGWRAQFLGFIRYMVERGSIGSSDVWRLQAEKWIGPPWDPHVVGDTIKEAEDRGYIVKTGNHVAPRDRKSHASQKYEWTRT
jgi:hypothetical protein